MREGVAHPRTVFEISERRTCSIVKADRKVVRSWWIFPTLSRSISRRRMQ